MHFDSLSQVYDFAVLYQKAPSDDMKNILASGLLMCGDSEKCVQYLKDGGENLWRDFSFAFLNGEGALKFLLQSQKPIYKDSFAGEIVSADMPPDKVASWRGGEGLSQNGVGLENSAEHFRRLSFHTRIFEAVLLAARHSQMVFAHSARKGISRRCGCVARVFPFDGTRRV